MLLLGYDVGSSSVKASLIDAETGSSVATAFQPKKEMKIIARKAGWAEQEPEQWWRNLVSVTGEVMQMAEIDASEIKSIGISYQMHGLVMVDRNLEVIRPSIIWCDSRAVPYGDHAFSALGPERCLSNLLNSPGNFTAAKLSWVIMNEPEYFRKTYKIMLPGDYIAMKMTGEVNTTISGLSEGIMWNFKENNVADFLLDYFGISPDMIPEIVPTFSEQGRLSRSAAEELGLIRGIPVSYRAGDQPNNAFSLNVLNPGEIAATAGTSGVVYGVSDEVKFDPESRVNTFAHVNHSPELNRLGVLLCINGTGIQYAWLKQNLAKQELNYPALNDLAQDAPIGSDGMVMLPFGNGAERMLGNRDLGATIRNIHFNTHTDAHLARASQEGVVFAIHYGMEIMREIGIHPNIIRAGYTNMFQSPIFRDTLAGITGATIELYDTDGSVGAAKGAGIGSGIFRSFKEAFESLNRIMIVEPDQQKSQAYRDAFYAWKKVLENCIKEKS
ncbi:MAG: carbohydrate kinase [Bacteroidales bacterium]|nr:carbohydrate kinase [Bacteroidales bacterium]